MTRQYDTRWCNGCGVEILWAPLINDHRDYCCQDCLDGLPCTCGQRMDMDKGRRARSADFTEEDLANVITDG